jgi:benzodiazapine receptor
MKNLKINWKIFILCLVIVYSVAYFGSMFTSQNTNSEWYSSIRPSITPPNWVFPIVWNILFFLISISLYLAWINSNKKNKKKVVVFYFINFVLNIFWSYLYFGIKRPDLAFIEIIFLEISIGFLIYNNYKINKKSSWLLVPYFLWVGFAGILNYLSI